MTDLSKLSDDQLLTRVEELAAQYNSCKQLIESQLVDATIEIYADELYIRNRGFNG